MFDLFDDVLDTTLDVGKKVTKKATPKTARKLANGEDVETEDVVDDAIDVLIGGSILDLLD